MAQNQQEPPSKQSKGTNLPLGGSSNHISAKAGNVDDDAYRLYIASMLKEEHEFLINCNASMDSMLVFAGLFSAVISALIVETRKGLVVDPQARVTLLLEALYNHSTGVESDITGQTFTPANSAKGVNLMFFVGLFCSLLAALGGLLVKQWARQSTSGPERPKTTRYEARDHYKNWDGLSRWRMNWIVAAVPMLLHIALLLFFIGLLWWLFEADSLVFGVMFSLISAAVLLYTWLGVVSARHPNAPFKWPFSSFLVLLLSMLQSESNKDLEANRLDDVSSLPSSSSQQLILPSVDKLSLCLSDEVDVAIFCRVLDHAVNKREMAIVLAHLYQMATSGLIQMHIISAQLVQLSLERCDELASRCYDVEDGRGTRETLRSDSIWEARLCCAYLQWVLTTPLFYLEPNLRSPARALRLVRSFRNNAVLVKHLDDLQLAMDSMFELQKTFYLTTSDCNLDDMLNLDALKLFTKMIPVFSTPSRDGIKDFQTRVTRYIWPITEFVMAYASRYEISNTEPIPSLQEAQVQETLLSGSFLDTFPPSTPRSVTLACKEIRGLLSRTDYSLYGGNYPDLLDRLTALWITQGPSGWALVWLRGILGPLLKGPEIVDGVRRITTLAGDAAAANVARDCLFS